MHRTFVLVLVLAFHLGFQASVHAATLHLGAITVEITPDQPVALDGQCGIRISQKPETPIQASVLAIESRDGDTFLDRAAIVPCDLVAIRDGVIGSNAFELCTDFGIQIRARSPGIQTFVIQLAGPGTYRPIERAVKHGGYGAVVQSSQIGLGGGQVLVEETVKAWKALWRGK